MEELPEGGSMNDDNGDLYCEALAWAMYAAVFGFCSAIVLNFLG